MTRLYRRWIAPLRARATAVGLLATAACHDANAPVVHHAATVQVSSTVTGRLALAMSTSFQPATWDANDFKTSPGAVTPLAALDPQHVRIQSISDGNPQTSPTTWDFSYLDNAAQPVLGVGDHSPELQLGQGPSFMNDSTGAPLDTTGQQFATYAAQMVRYYNTGGFTASDGHHASPSPNPITWWGIYNEPNISGVSAVEYARFYNRTVPAMQAVDPSLRFVAAEVTGDLFTVQNYVPIAIGSLNARVDAVAIHLYAMCNHATPDGLVMATVPTFGQSVLGTLASTHNNPVTASAPIWITENNVDADYDLGNGTSACNGNAFALDPRGSSAFFAAWRPYVFSVVGRAGARALYQWSFFGDTQFGEINRSTGFDQLSYWVDYWLARVFPAPPGANILTVANSDSSDVEVLAVKNDDSSAAIMIVNHGVASATDNNGHGVHATITVDVAALGTFNTATQLVIDAATDAHSGPGTPMSISPASPISVTLDGYGVAFLTLK